MPVSVSIGKDIETGEELWIGDRERCGGLYVLGKPRTGKSHLLKSLALQDAENDHGFLFIDPHEDAINDMIERLPVKRKDDVLLLDPTHKAYAFGINPLYCRDPDDLRERQLSFGQAWDVFAKVFGEEDGQLGILLSRYLGNCLYPLIENQGYSLYDIWLFLQDKPFRDALLSKVKYHSEVIDFWHEEFDRMPERDQREEIQALMRRIEKLRINPYIKHVISQATPQLNFTGVMERKQILLLRMPPSQDEVSKAFIGTLVISQLLKTIFLRTEISEHLRTPFAIYCDEFQTFATPDFAKLFTQTGKFQIMPTVAHQERLGQFKPGDPNRGATLAAPNKVLFSLAVHDSTELAPEFAREPTTTDTRLEPELVISQEPFWDLLRRGHTNQGIMQFVNKYLVPVPQALEDSKLQLEQERLKRSRLQDIATLYRDDATLSQADERSERQIRYHSAMSAAIEKTKDAIDRMRDTHIEVKRQNEYLEIEQGALRGFMRSIDYTNEFLRDVMLDRVREGSGNERFVKFLMVILGLNAQSYRGKSRHYCEWWPLLEFYLQVVYGDLRTPRSIPSLIAYKYFPRSAEKAFIEQQKPSLEKRFREIQKKSKEYEAVAGRKYPFHEDSVEVGIDQYLALYRQGEIFINVEGPLLKTTYYDNYHKKYEEGPTFLLPDLPVRVFSEDERQTLAETCEKEINASMDAGLSAENIWEAIDETIDFLALLQKPENHIKVPSGQYIEKPVNVRLVSDMTNEMAQELLNLPRFTAYAKVIQESAGKQIVITRKIKPLGLPKEHGLPLASAILTRSHALAYKPRTEIEEEIQQRQEPWRNRENGGKPPRRRRGKPPPTSE